MKMQIAVEDREQVASVDRCAVLSLELGELIEINFGDGEGRMRTAMTSSSSRTA